MTTRQFAIAGSVGIVVLIVLVLSAASLLSRRNDTPDLLSREKLFRLSAGSVDWSTTGLIAAGSMDRSVRVWGAGDGRATTLTDFDGGVAVVRWSPDGRRLAIVSNEPTRPLRVWDSTTGQT